MIKDKGYALGYVRLKDTSYMLNTTDMMNDSNILTEDFVLSSLILLISFPVSIILV